jgi:two-component system, cell cycle response regulator
MMGGHYGAVEETLRTILDDGADSAVESHEGDAPAVCMLTLAEARRLDHRYAAAQKALDAAVALAEQRGLDRVRAQARQEQAALFAVSGRFEEAYEEHRAFHAAVTILHSAQREARARALQAVFEEPITGTLPVTTSIGVTTAPDGPGTPAELLSVADRNLYIAKREGRDRVVADR